MKYILVKSAYFSNIEYLEFDNLEDLIKKRDYYINRYSEPYRNLKLTFYKKGEYEEEYKKIEII